jgi:hypothetical protein
MELTANSRFIVTDLSTGKVYYPRGLYWNKYNLVIVGARNKDHSIRLSLRADNVRVEVQG